jgi:hypothetical protein
LRQGAAGAARIRRDARGRSCLERPTFHPAAQAAQAISRNVQQEVRDLDQRFRPKGLVNVLQHLKSS